MDKPDKNPMEFFNKATKILDDAVKNVERQQRIQGFKDIRETYLDMIEAGFTMDEVMSFFAAMFRQFQKDDEE
jgi:hypothetical protein